VQNRRLRQYLLIGALGVLVVWMIVSWALNPRFSGAVSELESGEKKERLRAVARLEEDGSQDAARALHGFVRDDDVEVAARVMYALGRLGYEESLPPLKEALADERPAVQEAALNAMSQSEKLFDGPAVVALFERPTTAPNVKVMAAEALARRDYFEAMPALAQGLRDPSPSVQGRAGAAMERLIGRDFGLTEPKSPEDRRQAIAKLEQNWRYYYEANKARAEHLKEQQQ
jgi:HEAT repeat protein